MSDQRVFEEKADHYFRTEIPNVIFELQLSMCDIQTYLVLKRIAGDNGKCWKSNKHLCEMIGIGETKYRESLRVLQQPQALLNGKSLITLHKRFRQDGSPETNLIEINPIWRENGDHFRTSRGPSPHEGGGSPHEVPPPSPREPPVSPREGKEEPIKKEPIRDDNVNDNEGCKQTSSSTSSLSSFTSEISGIAKDPPEEQRLLFERLSNYEYFKIKPSTIKSWMRYTNYTCAEMHKALDYYGQMERENLERGKAIPEPEAYLQGIITKRHWKTYDNREEVKKREKAHEIDKKRRAKEFN